jgi:lipopolysaccharide biosynthesis protein
MRILATIHVFYPEFWPELAGRLRNVSAPCDIIVTLPHASDFAHAIQRDFPDARVMFCENRGFDLWPFFRTLNEVDLTEYTHVLKLHTKRDVHTNPPTTFNAFDYEGPRWRNALLSFLADEEAFDKCRKLMERDQSVSMVAGRDVILRRKDVRHAAVRRTFDEALSYAAESFGIHPQRPEFVAGTMFIAKAGIFTPFIGRFSAEDFVASVKDDAIVTRAHLLERVLGFAACAAGRIADPDDSMRLRHLKSDLFYAAEAVRRFFYQSKTTRSGARIVKVCHIPVCHSKGKAS